MNSPSSTTDNAFSLPIGLEIRRVAREFALNQPTTEKAEQVLLNTIAVSVINNYLTMLSIDTSLASSDSWNPIMQLCENVADLDISGVGKLECRPIKSGADSCYIPLEVSELRVGYVVVQIDDSLKTATILGFTPQVTTENLPLTNLRPPEDLIDRIHQLENSVLNNNDNVVNLGEWFNNVVETGWQTINSLLNPPQLTPAFNFRNTELPNLDFSDDGSVTKVKVIDLGVQLDNHNVILLVKLTPEENNNIGVILQVHSQSNDICLPEGLELKVLEAANTVFMEVQARDRDNYIQLQFSGQSEEVFTVEIALNEVNFQERFKL